MSIPESPSIEELQKRLEDVSVVAGKIVEALDERELGIQALDSQLKFTRTHLKEHYQRMQDCVSKYSTQVNDYKDAYDQWSQLTHQREDGDAGERIHSAASGIDRDIRQEIGLRQNSLTSLRNSLEATLDLVNDVLEINTGASSAGENACIHVYACLIVNAIILATSTLSFSYMLPTNMPISNLRRFSRDASNAQESQRSIRTLVEKESRAVGEIQTILSLSIADILRRSRDIQSARGKYQKRAGEYQAAVKSLKGAPLDQQTTDAANEIIEAVAQGDREVTQSIQDMSSKIDALLEMLTNARNAVGSLSTQAVMMTSHQHVPSHGQDEQAQKSAEDEVIDFRLRAISGNTTGPSSR